MDAASPKSEPVAGQQSPLRTVLLREAAAIQAATELLDDQAQIALELLVRCQGRVIVTGMGKMGCIGRKAAATWCSTGTPAFYLHPSEAMHGDLGIVTEKDVLVALSHSGETREVLELLPLMTRWAVPCIAITATDQNSLARRAQAVLRTGVLQEADDIAQAPTSSTTVTLALCDALALALMQRRGFTADQFAIFHPGGFLGSKLLVQVADLMHPADQTPVATEQVSLQEAVGIMSGKSMGAVFVVDPQGQVLGVLTDGDLRRILEAVAPDSAGTLLQAPLSNYMHANPRRIPASALAAEALRMMEDHQITVLPVIDSDQRIVGVIHLHDLIRAGLA